MLKRFSSPCLMARTCSESAWTARSATSLGSACPIVEFAASLLVASPLQVAERRFAVGLRDNHAMTKTPQHFEQHLCAARAQVLFSGRRGRTRPAMYISFMSYHCALRLLICSEEPVRSPLPDVVSSSLTAPSVVDARCVVPSLQSNQDTTSAREYGRERVPMLKVLRLLDPPSALHHCLIVLLEVHRYLLSSGPCHCFSSDSCHVALCPKSQRPF